MKESIGSTASLNIVFVFIAIIFAFLAASLSYYKAFKVNNIISNSILKYEGYNNLSINEINTRLNSIGYQRYDANCGDTKNFNGQEFTSINNGQDGICVYMNVNGKYYQYGITTYMTINLPVIGELIKIPINTTSNEIYGCFGNNGSTTVNLNNQEFTINCN